MGASSEFFICPIIAVSKRNDDANAVVSIPLLCVLLLPLILLLLLFALHVRRETFESPATCSLQ